MSIILKVELSEKELGRLNLLLAHYETTVEGYIPFLIFKEFLLHDFRSCFGKNLIEKKCVASNNGVLHTL